MAYDMQQSVNPIFRISLDLAAGKLTLSEVGKVQGAGGYPVGAPKLSSSGKIIIPAASAGGSAGGSGGGPAEEGGRLISFDTASGNQTSGSLSASISDLGVCESAEGERLFALGSSRSENAVSTSLFEVAISGATLDQRTVEGISAILAGTALCQNGKFMFVGEDSSQERKLFSYSLQDDTWKSVPLPHGNLKYIAPVSRPLVAPLTAAAARTFRYSVIKSADIKACASKFRRQFKKSKSSKIRSANSILKQFQFTKKGANYACALKK